MKVTVVTDIRLLHYKERYYVHNAVSTILNRYSDNFGRINILCRVIELDELNDFTLCDVTESIDCVVAFKSFVDYARNTEKKRINRVLANSDLVILRTPSILACAVYKTIKRNRIPYFAEAMGDAWDSYWNHSFIGKVLAPYIYITTKKIFNDASYTLYVTEKFLQKKYPCHCSSINASNVCIHESNYLVLQNRIEKIKQMNCNHLKVMTTAGVNVRAKGHKYVIEALAILKEKGIIITYYLVGGGDQTYLKKIAKKNKVENQIVFLGEVEHNKVFDLIDEIDVYIQPSLQEGLPRSVIEAMSRGCPCLGSNTAGTPELLDYMCIFKRRSSKDIVKKIESISKKEILIELANSNFNCAKRYEESILNKRRNKYFRKIKKEILF